MIAQYTLFEAAFTSTSAYENPFWDVDQRLRFTAPSGRQQTIDAYWDDGDVWRVRFSPDETGTWTWVTTCSDHNNSGLHGQQGTFECTAYEGANSLYQNGPLKVSADGHSLAYADDTPFFWLADTAWNGVLRAKAEDWQRYLTRRREQGFTVIQFVSTHWRGLTRDDLGELAFTGDDRIVLNVPFFQRLDPKVAAINAHGLIASPIMLWTLTDTDPGQVISETACIRFVRYLQARWGAYQVVWMVGGDGCYERSGLVEKFQHIGRAVFEDRHDRLATLHPCGQVWIKEDFGGETWFDFIGYQSGHGDSNEHLRWLVEGPPVSDWNSDPVIPVINLEPNYETHPSYHSKTVFGAYEVRRASYWSLLVSPTAGVTYGHNAIWVWPSEKPEPAENHNNIGLVQPWYTALDTPALESMAVLHRFFDALPWWRLRPAQGVLVVQPGSDDPRRFIAAAQTSDGQQTVIYLPEGESITVYTNQLNQPTHARWHDPRSGTWHDAVLTTLPEQTFVPPDEQDWLLVFD